MERRAPVARFLERADPIEDLLACTGERGGVELAAVGDVRPRVVRGQTLGQRWVAVPDSEDEQVGVALRGDAGGRQELRGASCS